MDGMFWFCVLALVISFAIPFAKIVSENELNLFLLIIFIGSLCYVITTLIYNPPLKSEIEKDVLRGNGIYKIKIDTIQTIQNNKVAKTTYDTTFVLKHLPQHH